MTAICVSNNPLKGVEYRLNEVRSIHSFRGLTFSDFLHRTRTVLVAALVSLLLQISTLLSCEFGSNATGDVTIGLLRYRSIDEPVCHFYRPNGRLEAVPRYGAVVGLCFSALVFGVIVLSRCESLLVATLFAGGAACQAMTFLLFLSDKSFSFDNGAWFSAYSTLTMLVTSIFNITKEENENVVDDDDESSSSTSTADNRPASIGVIGTEIAFNAAHTELGQQHHQECTKPNYVISEKTGQKLLSRNIQQSMGLSPSSSLIHPISSSVSYSTFWL